MKFTSVFTAACLFACSLSFPVAAQTNLTSQFPYQGALSNQGVPANGIYDFEFRLYDALSSGNQVGVTQTISNVQVTNGVFTVALNFGDSVFDGKRRFLETRVAPDGNSLQILTPRLELDANPYSQYALKAGQATTAATADFATQSGTTGVFNSATGLINFSNGSTVDLSGLRLTKLSSAAGVQSLTVTGENGTISVGDTTTSARLKVVGNTDVTNIFEATDSSSNPALVVNKTRNVAVSGTPISADRFRIDSVSTDTNVLNVLDNSQNSIIRARQDGDVLISNTFSSNSGNMVEVLAEENIVRIPGGFAVDLDTLNSGAGTQFFDDVQLNVRSSPGDNLIFLNELSGGADVFRVGTNGNVEVFGNFTVSNGSKNFQIDHPAEPATKALRHNAVEGPGFYTFYHGSVVLDSTGSGEAQLPDYFDALNGGGEAQINYQLTPIGASMPGLYVSREAKGNSFTISGGVAGAKVSWQVTAERQDPWAKDHPYEAVVEKSPAEQGHYYYPEGYGAEKSLGISSIPQGKASAD